MTNFCGNSDITKIFIVEPGNAFTGNTIDGNLIVNGNIINCGSGSTIYTETILPCFTAVTINNAITITPYEVLPTSDDLISLGSPLRRYRDINTISGTSTVWTSTGVIYTPVLNLGTDLSGNTRIITAESSIIQDDCLLGGTY